MVSKNLGHVTAYGYAKSEGYAGTEEEYAELMANYATVGQSCAQSAQTATDKASEAEGYADDAHDSAVAAASYKPTLVSDIIVF